MLATPRAERLLPTGTITFLFTDIEGSTPLWDMRPAAMGEATDRHNALRDAFDQGARGGDLK